jgi:hypothetical protein
MSRLGHAACYPQAAQAFEHPSAAIVLMMQRTKRFVRSTIHATFSAILP